MLFKIIKNDIKRNKLIALLSLVFIFLATLLVSTVFLVGMNLFGAIDGLMDAAKTPHFMQMHSGTFAETETKALADFTTTQSNVAAYQVLNFLGIEQNEFLINGQPLVGTFQDNGLSTQSPYFDYLLDVQGNIVEPQTGEIYVPTFYQKDGIIKTADIITIQQQQFKVVGFIRDSQMNAALASSKRFIINEQDYQRLQAYGKEEYLLEFRLKDTTELDAFVTAYELSGLPANGPALTYPLFRMVNAISDGLMLALLFLMGMLTTIIALLCVRFTLLAKIEDDYREIGTMKAIGITTPNIQKIYLMQYRILAILGITSAFFLAILIQPLFLKNITLHLGKSANQLSALLLSVLAIVLLYGVIILYIRLVLRRFKSISPIQAIHIGIVDNARVHKLPILKKVPLNLVLALHDIRARKKLYLTLFVITILATFIMVVPRNLYQTIASPQFVTYMGVGKSDLRLDMQQQDIDILDTFLKTNPAIEAATILTTRTFAVDRGIEGKEHIKIELGDHQIFPVQYVAGTFPQQADELALSTLNAERLQVGVGDELTITIAGSERKLLVCGVYSDITNGGKTAKATFVDDTAPLAWRVAYLKGTDRATITALQERIKAIFPEIKVSSIQDFVTETFGQTVKAIAVAATVALGVAVLLLATITVLFLKLLLAKDRYSIGVLKALGFTDKTIQQQYRWRFLLILSFGIFVGTVLAATVGEKLAGLAIASFGATAFHFETNYIFTFVLAPLLMVSVMPGILQLSRDTFTTISISAVIKE